MIVPLIVLAVASLLGGFLGLPGKLGADPELPGAGVRAGQRTSWASRSTAFGPSTTC